MTAASVALAAALIWALVGTAGRRAGRRGAARVALPAAVDGQGHDLLQRLGAQVAALVPGAPPLSPGLTRRIGIAVPAALAVTVAVGPGLGAVVAAAAVVPAVLRQRRRRAADRERAIARLPDLVDLLAVGARAGLPAAAAVAHVAERAPPAWRGALQAVAARVRRGDRFADTLDELGAVDAERAADGLRAVLRSAADDGADLVAGLDRLAADTRDLRRRRAEEAARRVPVRLLLPLVACSLPAFALLTIVPIVAGSLEDLGL
jgi:Flp pilus assembly protein TadB